MTRILLIDDDPALLDVLSLALEDAGFDVVVAEDGQAGLAAVGAHQPEIVVSDVNMPRLDGFSLCRRLRESGSAVPVILLTSRDSEIDEALGLELGADDYVTKPFSTRILLARIGALVRREVSRGSTSPPTAAVRIGHLSLDADRLEIRYRETPVTITVTEFRMIGEDAGVAERLVDTYIRRMRRKFEEIDPDFQEIETVVGAGYRWRG
jgi:DNA-binding response OmpR family regulator